MAGVNRGLLRRALQQWIASSTEMANLQAALNRLYPRRTGRPLRVERLAEAVLFSALRGHEGATRGALGRLSSALARLLDDVDALTHGRAIEGRAPEMRTKDLKALASALEELTTLEDRIRHALDSDPTWADSMRVELETALHGRGAGRRPTTHPTGAAVGAAMRTVREAADLLRLALARAGLTPQSIWHTRQLPDALRRSAHELFVAAGEDIAVAVRHALQFGGSSADAMVTALLWAEGHIAPGRPSGASGAAAHQTSISGIEFEWMGQNQPNSWNGRFDPHSIEGTVGIDHIANGMLVDAKHTSGPVERHAHITGEPAPRTPLSERVDLDVNSHVGQPDTSWAHGDPGRATRMANALEQQHGIMDQMRRQLQWARERGLRGINWVTNTAEMADAIRLLMDRIPTGERAGLQVNVTIGGLR